MPGIKFYNFFLSNQIYSSTDAQQEWKSVGRNIQHLHPEGWLLDPRCDALYPLVWNSTIQQRQEVWSQPQGADHLRQLPVLPEEIMKWCEE